MRLKSEVLFLIFSCVALLALALPIASYTYPAYDEGWLMSKAYQFLHHGKMAFTGMGNYLNFDSHTFTEMPLRSLVTSLFFFLFGTGILQARLVSVLMAMSILLLSYQVSKDAFGKTTAIVTVFLLFFLRLSIFNEFSGMPLLDLAASARYDIDQALWILLSIKFFIHGYKNQKASTLAFSGFFAGLAVLSHLYALVLPFTYLLFFISEKKPFRKPAVSVFIAFAITLLPYFIWVVAHFEDYKNQMTWYYDRGNYLSSSFYLVNIQTEIHRYFSRLSEGGSFIKYLVLPGIVLSATYLFREYRHNKSAVNLKLMAHLLVSTPLLFLFFESTKMPIYLSSVFPFLVMSLAAILVSLYQHAGSRIWKYGVGLFLLFILADGIRGITLKFQKTFEKENATLTVDFLHQHIHDKATVLTFSHFWPALRENSPVDFARVGFEFRRSKMTGVSDSTNLQNILDEINPEYLVFFGGFEDWMRFFSRPYYDSFSKAWEYQVKTKFEPVASRYSNIYGEVFIYKNKDHHPRMESIRN